jgi:hypothetical protein
MTRTSWCRRESPMMPEAMCPTPLNIRTTIPGGRGSGGSGANAARTAPGRGGAGET